MKVLEVMGKGWRLTEEGWVRSVPPFELIVLPEELIAVRYGKRISKIPYSKTNLEVIEDILPLVSRALVELTAVGYNLRKIRFFNGGCIMVFDKSGELIHTKIFADRSLIIHVHVRLGTIRNAYIRTQTIFVSKYTSDVSLSKILSVFEGVRHVPRDEKVGNR